MVDLAERFKECKLEIHPEKTKMVYCGRRSQKETYQGSTSFVFLGYEFRTRSARDSRTGKIFGSFLPAISPKAKKAITQKIRELNVRNKSDLSLQQIAKWLNPMIRGWMEYYGKFTKSALNSVFRRLNGTLVRWSMKKYKKLANRPTYAARHMGETARRHTELFAHWKAGITDVFI